jgi:hypothetical protein
MPHETRRLLALVMVWGYLCGLVSPTRTEPRVPADLNLADKSPLGTLPTFPPVAPPADRVGADQHVPANQQLTGNPTPAVRVTHRDMFGISFYVV